MLTEVLRVPWTKLYETIEAILPGYQVIWDGRCGSPHPKVFGLRAKRIKTIKREQLLTSDDAVLAIDYVLAVRAENDAWYEVTEVIPPC